MSDLLQNVTAYSHYRILPDYERFRQTAYGLSVFVDLSGVDVELVYLRNEKAVRHQTPRHLEFWQAYFADAGAAAVMVVW